MMKNPTKPQIEQSRPGAKEVPIEVLLMTQNNLCFYFYLIIDEVKYPVRLVESENDGVRLFCMNVKGFGKPENEYVLTQLDFTKAFALEGKSYIATDDLTTELQYTAEVPESSERMYQD